MRTRCRDCGTRDYAMTRTCKTRTDVCDGCYKTRGELVAGEIVTLGGPEFLEIQRAMANGRGTAKRLIDAARSNTPAPAADGEE